LTSRIEVVSSHQSGSHVRLRGGYAHAARLVERARADVRRMERAKSGSERRDDCAMLFG
jgi:hypothetical protein